MEFFDEVAIGTGAGETNTREYIGNTMIKRAESKQLALSPDCDRAVSSFHLDRQGIMSKSMSDSIAAKSGRNCGNFRRVQSSSFGGISCRNRGKIGPSLPRFISLSLAPPPCVGRGEIANMIEEN